MNRNTFLKLLSLSFVSYFLPTRSRALPRDVIISKKSTGRVMKRSTLFSPDHKRLQDFHTDLTRWVNLDRYDKIKAQYMASGLLLSATSDKSTLPATFEYVFSSNQAMLNFERDLKLNHVFRSQERLKLGYKVEEIFYFT